MRNNFIYYNHAYIPECPEVPLEGRMSFRDIQKKCIDERYRDSGGGYFATYITDFDVADQTEWWFTIKDDEYDLSVLSAKKRYEVTKAHKFCYSKKINPLDNIDALFDCHKQSFEGYAEVERPSSVQKESFIKYIHELAKDGKRQFYACYFKDDDKLIGFLIIHIRGDVIGLQQQKTIPSYEKYNCNASLIDCMLTEWNEKLKKHEVIISNGSRNIRHLTNFNAYLEKYFGFRKAYARLKIAYRFPFGILVFLLKPFIKLFEKTDNPFFYNIYCVLKMDSFKYREK